MEVTGGDSFDGDGGENSLRILVGLSDGSDTAVETVNADPHGGSTQVFDDPSLFSSVGGGDIEYESSAGADQDFSDGDTMQIRIDADNSGVEVTEVQLRLIDDSSGDLLYEDAFMP